MCALYTEHTYCPPSARVTQDHSCVAWSRDSNIVSKLTSFKWGASASWKHPNNHISIAKASGNCRRQSSEQPSALECTNRERTEVWTVTLPSPKCRYITLNETYDIGSAQVTSPPISEWHGNRLLHDVDARKLYSTCLTIHSPASWREYTGRRLAP
jgi:hypothetical protein